MFRKRDLGSINLTGAPPVGKEPPLVGIAFSRCLIYGGIILPTLAILCEMQFHICARYFFDPFPSNSHTLLFSLVPVAGLLSWLVLGQNVRSQYGLALFANGMAVGIAILYTLMFLPIMPASAAAIIYLGFGLLGLAPFFSLLALWASGNKMEKLHKSFGSYFEPPQVTHAGHLVILATVLAVELPSTVTRVAMGMACKPETQEQGLNILRTFGNQEVMLRACYERSGRATDVLGSLYEVSHPANVELMREIFYKTTGRTFNSFPIPESARSTMNHMGTLKYDGMDQGADDEFDLDPDVAGEVVSGVSRGLSVSKSDMKANVDADAGVGQIDWFLDFKNVSKFDREVRTRIRLPHGAAVNQASLIVNGKEYECDVTLKEQARQIYQAAVAAKQNPLLVSQCGKDTVLVQCYPVPPGEALKLHLGVVAPVALRKDLKGAMALPQFEERNFQINVPYTLKIEANHEIKAQLGQLKNEKQNGKFILSGDLEPGALATGNGIITFERDKSQEFWTKDIFADGEYLRMLQEANAKAAASAQTLVPGVSAGSSAGYEGTGCVEALPESTPPSAGEASTPSVGEASPPTITDKAYPAEIDDRPYVTTSRIAEERTTSTAPATHANGAAPAVSAVGGPACGVAIAIDQETVVSSPACGPVSSASMLKVFGKVVDTKAEKPKSLIVLVDLSNSMGEHLKEVVSALKNLPADLYVQLICVGDDGPLSLNSSWLKADSSEFKNVLQQLSEKKCVGGQTDFALNTVLSASEAGGGVLWIHGPQPYGVQIIDLDSQRVARFDRTKGRYEFLSKKLFDMQIASGPNAFLDGVTSSSLITVPRFASVEDDLNLLFDTWKNPGNLKTIQYMASQETSLTPELAYSGPATQNSSVSSLSAKQGGQQTKMYQLAQLYAVSKINEYLQNHNEYAALNLAAKYHLVTPVSSAVLADTVSELDSLSRPAIDQQNDTVIQQLLRLSLNAENNKAVAASQNALSTVARLSLAPGLGLTGCSSGSMSDHSGSNDQEQNKYFGTIVNQLNRLNSVPSQPSPNYTQGRNEIDRDLTANVETKAKTEASTDSSFIVQGQLSRQEKAPRPISAPMSAPMSSSDELANKVASVHSFRKAKMLSAKQEPTGAYSASKPQMLQGATNGTIFEKKEIALDDAAPMVTDKRSPAEADGFAAEESSSNSGVDVISGVVAAGGGSAGSANLAGATAAGAPGCAIPAAEGIAGKQSALNSTLKNNMPVRSDMPSTPCLEFKKQDLAKDTGVANREMLDQKYMEGEKGYIEGVNTAGTVSYENDDIAQMFQQYLMKYWFAFAGLFIFIYSITKITMEKMGIKDK